MLRKYAVLFPVCLTVLASGCFRMVNVDPRTVTPYEDLRVELTPEAADRAAREFGTVGSRLVGRLTPSGPDSVDLDAWMGQFYTDASLARARIVVPLHRSEVVEVQRRELSVRRTLLASAVGAGMIALLLSRTTLFVGESPDDDTPGPPPPPEESFMRRGRGWTISIPLPIPIGR